MLIGISGYAGSGKDLAANIIRYLTDGCDDYMSFDDYMHQLFMPKFEVVRFADNLKKCASIILGCSLSELEDRRYKESNLGQEWSNNSPRTLLQKLGADFGRNMIHPDIWVNSTIATYIPEKDWIVPDVRFENEADAIKNKGGVLIRLNRITNADSTVHESESALDNYFKFDYIIDNNGSIDELIKVIKDILIKEHIIK